MGQIPLYTKAQRFIFNQVSQDPYIKTHFYFTGGTALSAFYLNHRYSEDLDFFSEEKLDIDRLESTISRWANLHNFLFDVEHKSVVSIFILKFSDHQNLKVDFGYYPHPRVETGKKFAGLAIDSLLDISINKLVAMNQRAAAKDYVDLFFLLQHYTIWDLLEGARGKFHREIEPWLLSADLQYAQELTSLPKMIKPLTLPTLKKFFRDQAQILAKTVVE